MVGAIKCLCSGRGGWQMKDDADKCFRFHQCFMHAFVIGEGSDRNTL